MAFDNISRRDALRTGAAAGATALGGIAAGASTAVADTASRVDVALYVDHHVYEDHGYDPAKTLQTLLCNALEYNDVYAYEVTVVRDHGFDVRDLSSDGPCGDILPEFDDYLIANDRKSAHENHHLVYHSEDSLGGCAWPRVSVGHGDGLAALDTYSPSRFGVKTRNSADDATGDAIQVSLQEVGHTLGMCDGSNHNCGMHYTDDDAVHGNPTLPGDGNDVYTTPMGASWGGNNQCSQYADDPGSYDTEYGDAYYWYDCAGAQLRSHFDRTHTVTIDGANNDAWTSYKLSVSGSLSKSTKCGANTNDHDTISGSTADGWVYGGRDTYEFTGRITDFTFDGSLQGVYVNCEEVLVDSLGENTITLDGQSDSEYEYYQFTVSGGLRKSRANGASINDPDRVRGRTADGYLYKYADSYNYWGGVHKSGFDDGGATVTFSST